MESFYQGVYAIASQNQISINGTTGAVKVGGETIYTATPATLRAEAAKCATSAASAVALTDQDEARVRYDSFRPMAAPEAGGGILTFGNVRGGLGTSHANPGLIVRLSAAEATSLAAGGTVT